MSRNMREIRFLFDPIQHTGVRQFIEKNYGELKHLNPGLPILSRTGECTTPRVFALYDWGEERVVEVPNHTEPEVAERVRELVEIGETMEKGPESFPGDRDIIDEYDVRINDTY
jgi:NADH dehydrogenase (ubiquinone) 1 alpha subcomplex subunit 2